jgi:hypothetical protein
MNNHRPQGSGDAGPDHSRDVVPIGGGGHAGAAELEHNPGLTIFQHYGDRTCDFNSAPPDRVLSANDSEARGSAPVGKLIVFENVAQFFF